MSDGAMLLAGGDTEGDIFVCEEGLSFWGGVNPNSGEIIDVHHHAHGASVSGRVLMMPTSRGSCSGSGVLLQLALNGRAPAALVFREDEEILTLGAMVAERLFNRMITVIRLGPAEYEALADQERAEVLDSRLLAASIDVPLRRPDIAGLQLSDCDRAVLAGEAGEAAQIAMEIICLMGISQGATNLVDVTRGHIDGSILAHSANLIFAETMATMGAIVTIPTTINAISVDRDNWGNQGVAEDFGGRASRLADAYVAMGAKPTYTCAPYLLESPPEFGECIAWSESNAVIYANSVLGARTPKFPDYLDLFIAMTGRAAISGVYTDSGRVARRVVQVTVPAGFDEAFWPLLGWLSGKASPDRVPLLVGLEESTPTADDLKNLCAAFGTMSGAPMLHIQGVTPEACIGVSSDAEFVVLGQTDFVEAWQEMNAADEAVDLVAIGSPHVSLDELRVLARLFQGKSLAHGVDVIVTLGRGVLSMARTVGIAPQLEAIGIRLLPDLCWCSITEPVLPCTARVLMTNSAKFAHYACGLSGRSVRFGGLSDCVEAAVSGRLGAELPGWLSPVTEPERARLDVRAELVDTD